MYFNPQAFEDWKYIPASGFADPTFALSTVVSGTLLPFTGSEQWRNRQEFSEVKYRLYCESPHMGIVEPRDFLRKGTVWYRVVYLEPYRSVIPHDEIYLADSQGGPDGS